jgi:hypothetical protein
MDFAGNECCVRLQSNVARQCLTRQTSAKVGSHFSFVSRDKPMWSLMRLPEGTDGSYIETGRFLPSLACGKQPCPMTLRRLHALGNEIGESYNILWKRFPSPKFIGIEERCYRPSQSKDTMLGESPLHLFSTDRIETRYPMFLV